MFTAISIRLLQDGSRYVAGRVGSGVANTSRFIYSFAMLILSGQVKG
jgi:hypothetical protein